MWQALHVKNKKITLTAKETSGSEVKHIEITHVHPKHGETGGQTRAAYL